MSRFWLILGVLALAANASAQEAFATNRTVVTSDRLEFDYRQSYAIFEGNVLVEDSRIRIRCEKLTVIFEQGNNMRSVTATGNVRIWQGDRKATCRRAVFRSAANEVTLTGDATVTRGNDFLAGNIITFWTDSERLVSEPGYLQIVPRGTNAPAALRP